MSEISEERRIFRKKIITIIGLLLSLIGATVSLVYGINALNSASSWEEYYFYILLALMGLTIFGDIIGFYRKAVGIGVSIVIGFIGVICVFYFISLFFMGFFIPILLILIGGLIGVIVNYDNLKRYINERKN
ncbi:MAG: hypothetical protein ACW98A_17305 [Candidatus Hodarchaeales archaeon]